MLYVKAGVRSYFFVGARMPYFFLASLFLQLLVLQFKLLCILPSSLF